MFKYPDGEEDEEEEEVWKTMMMKMVIMKKITMKATTKLKIATKVLMKNTVINNGNHDHNNQNIDDMKTQTLIKTFPNHATMKRRT